MTRKLVLALALGALAAAAGCKLLGGSLPADFRRGGLELVYALTPTPEWAGRDAALAEEMVYRIRLRIEALKLCRPDITTAGREVTVRLPAECGPATARIKRLLGGRGRLEFREVDGGDALAALAERVTAAGLALGTDRWTDHASGGTRQARVVEGAADALERFRAGLPADAVPAGVEPLIERGATAPRPARLYLVRREAPVTSAQVIEARVFEDPRGGLPSVDVDMNLRGVQLFREQTSRLVGHKLAIVLDGRILATPVVASAIGGGSARVTLPADLDAAQAAQVAQDLVIMIRNGVLPAPLVPIREKLIPATR